MNRSEFASRLSTSVSPTSEKIREITTLGLRYIEVLPFEEKTVVHTNEGIEGRIAKVREELASFGVTPASMHAPTSAECDFGNFDEGMRNIALRHHKRHLGYCSRIGAALYVVHPGGLIHAKWDDKKKIGVWTHDHKFTQRLWRLNSDALATLADSAKELGIRVCLENGWLNDPNFMTLDDFLGILS